MSIKKKDDKDAGEKTDKGDKQDPMEIQGSAVVYLTHNKEQKEIGI
jgi:hypothetical protein